MKACKEAIKEADAVIAKQGELLLLVSERNEYLRDENSELAAAIVTLSREVDNSLDRQITYGAVGVVLGALAMMLVAK